jgi:hypothetical protein
VTLLGFLAYLTAVVQMLTALASVILLLRPGQVQILFQRPVSDWYWVITAALSAVLFFAYIWLGRGILAGEAYAWPVVNLLALINLAFGALYLFQGTGWATVILSALVLLLNNLRGVREWYADSR